MFLLFLKIHFYNILILQNQLSSRYQGIMLYKNSGLRELLHGSLFPYERRPYCTQNKVFDFAGLPEIKDSEGKSAFQFLLKSGRNSEKLLKILRAEQKCLSDRVMAEEEDIKYQQRVSAAAEHSLVDDTHILNVSGNSINHKETLGIFFGDF